jgi:hypothetical protein
VAHTTAWGYGFRARREIGLADFPAPRNDIGGATCEAVQLAGERWIEIAPFWIASLYQIYFPTAPPFFELLFSANRIFNIIITLEPNKKMHPISGGKAGDCVCPVLVLLGGSGRR